MLGTSVAGERVPWRWDAGVPGCRGAITPGCRHAGMPSRWDAVALGRRHAGVPSRRGGIAPGRWDAVAPPRRGLSRRAARPDRGAAREIVRRARRQWRSARRRGLPGAGGARRLRRWGACQTTSRPPEDLEAWRVAEGGQIPRKGANPAHWGAAIHATGTRHQQRRTAIACALRLLELHRYGDVPASLGQLVDAFDHGSVPLDVLKQDRAHVLPRDLRGAARRVECAVLENEVSQL